MADKVRIIPKSSTFTLDVDDLHGLNIFCINVDTSLGSVTANLPIASSVKIPIQLRNAGVNNLIIEPYGAETINGDPNHTITTQNGTVGIVSDGSNWFILYDGVNGGGGATVLDDLTDVNAPTPSNNDALTWNTATSKWINQAGGGGMVYPGAGIPLSTGVAWGTPIADNSANWNSAYGWGNHAGLYTPVAHKTTEDAINGLVKVNGAGSYSAVTDNSGNWNTAYGWGNHASVGYLTTISGQSLDNLGDVNAPTPSNNEVLTWNTATSKWINQAGGGGGMIYPGVGIALSTGSAWAGSIADASANWNTAYTHSTLTNNPHSTSDANLSITDILTNNVSTTKHGFAPKLSNIVTEFLNGQGGWTVPAGGGGTSDHSALSNLSYATAGHTGFQPTLGYTAENVANKDQASGYVGLDASKNAVIDGYVKSAGGLYVPENATSQSSIAGHWGIRAKTVDDLDTYCVIALEFEGVDYSVLFPDSSIYGYPVTGAGNVRIDTSQFFWGASSLYEDGSGDYLWTVASANWNFGSGSWGFECRVRYEALTNDVNVFLTGQDSGTNWWQIYYQVSAGGRIRIAINSNNYYFAWVPSLNTWYTVGIFGVAGIVSAYINGTQIGASQAITMPANNGHLELLGNSGASNQTPKGWINSLYIDKGIARYTSNYTPRTTPRRKAGLYTVDPSGTLNLIKIERA